MLSADYRNQEEGAPSFREERMEQRKRRPAILAGVLIGIAAAGAIGWMTFGRYVSVYQDAGGELPVIKADVSVERMRPETPGGMDVPNQDKLVYERLRQSESELPVERLLPVPETPSAPEQEYAPLDVTGAQDSADPIGTLAEQVSEESEIAAAKIYDENGAPVEVMFRTASKKTETVPAASVEKAPVKEQAKPEPAVVKAVLAPVPVRQVPAGEFYSVQLLSTRTKDSAEQEWKRLAKKLNELTELPHSVSEVAVEKNVFYRLRVGQFKTREEAVRLCEQFKAKKQECLVVK